ncbi:MAG: hypothetical protein ACUVWR_12380 [Anaerolineae bacterium]
MVDLFGREPIGELGVNPGQEQASMGLLLTAAPLAYGEARTALFG